eukprot:GGOE01024266.1.p1 GENE.GGOE01024266.1~~GGOE01024266.1.p1  ORF type:complete len:228 (-),score=65.43 GGOE01024266.1:390-1046(-)
MMDDVLAAADPTGDQATSPSPEESSPVPEIGLPAPSDQEPASSSPSSLDAPENQAESPEAEEQPEVKAEAMGSANPGDTPTQGVVTQQQPHPAQQQQAPQQTLQQGAGVNPYMAYMVQLQRSGMSQAQIAAIMQQHIQQQQLQQQQHQQQQQQQQPYAVQYASQAAGGAAIQSRSKAGSEQSNDDALLAGNQYSGFGRPTSTAAVAGGMHPMASLLQR